MDIYLKDMKSKRENVTLTMRIKRENVYLNHKDRMHHLSDTTQQPILRSWVGILILI